LPSCLITYNNVVGGRTNLLQKTDLEELEMVHLDVEHKQTNQDVLSFGFVAPNNNSKKESAGNGVA
jgi:hypothetical protein